jgi:amino acid transporter
MGRERFIPGSFGRISSRGVPHVAIAVSFLVGIVVFLPFPGWQKLVGFITSASALAYSMAPVALSSLRRQLPRIQRPFRLPAEPLLAPAGFVVANLVIYWSGWSVVWRLEVALAIGFALFFAHRALARNGLELDWRSAAWLPPYLVGILVIDKLGQYGGTGTIPFWWDLGLVAVFSLAVHRVAVALRLPPDETQRYVEALQGEEAAEEAALRM